MPHHGDEEEENKRVSEKDNVLMFPTGKKQNGSKLERGGGNHEKQLSGAEEIDAKKIVEKISQGDPKPRSSQRRSVY